MTQKFRHPALPALAVAALLGGAGAGRAAPKEREGIILIEILIPADAELELQGVKMPGASAATAGLRLHLHRQGDPPGQDGHARPSLKHGMTNTLDLRPDFAAAAARAVIPTKPLPVGGPARAAAPTGPPKDVAALKKNAEAFVAAFHRGDAQAVAAAWAPDGEYVDLAGRRLPPATALRRGVQRYSGRNLLGEAAVSCGMASWSTSNRFCQVGQVRRCSPCRQRNLIQDGWLAEAAGGPPARPESLRWTSRPPIEDWRVKPQDFTVNSVNSSCQRNIGKPPGLG